MVRTRDGGARKAVAAKAPRKVLASSGGGGGALGALGSPSGKVSKYAGGNMYCPRPTPDWQKGIGAFIKNSKPPADKENAEPADEEEDVPVASSASAAEGSSSTAAAAEGSSSCSQGSSSSSAEPASSSSSSQPEPEPSSSASPVKKNGLISDSDED